MSHRAGEVSRALAAALGPWLGYRTNRVLPRRAFELALLAIAIAGSLRLARERVMIPATRGGQKLGP